MTNYYDEILTEIENLVKEGKYGDANFITIKNKRNIISIVISVLNSL